MASAVQRVAPTAGRGPDTVDQRSRFTSGTPQPRLPLSVYDASYVAGAQIAHVRLVSCDIRDLVSRELALLPESVTDLNG